MTETQKIDRPAPQLLARTPAGLYVFDKPAGLVVHAADGKGDDLLSWAREHVNAPAELAPINRLDRATSGLVLCGADVKLRAELGHALAAGTVAKEYRALVIGRARPKGVIRRPLKDARRGKAVEAVTRYRCLSGFGNTASYLRVRPETGRKHQIRRHLQGIGHSVVGDERYPPRRFRPVPGFPGRLWLHCYGLVLPGGERFRANLPEVLQRHLELLAEAPPAKQR